MHYTPLHLGRLRHFAEERWGFAFHTNSIEKYSLFVYDDGEFFSTPEEALRLSADTYLND